jgi:hypothetical protein
MATPVVPSAAIWLETRADTLLQLESYAVLPGPHIYITDGSPFFAATAPYVLQNLYIFLIWVSISENRSV